jgi:hypothetical protein
MPGPEREPNALPKELADFLKERPFACITQATDQGTVLVVKAPNREIQSIRGRVPIRVVHELFSHPAAPVIRMTVRIYDQARNPLALETFINVEDPQQRSDYAALAQQDTIYMLFYDETLRHRLSKGVNNVAREDISQVLDQADRLFASIPKERFDFDKAKAQVIERTEL